MQCRLTLGCVQLSGDAPYVARHSHDGVMPQQFWPQWLRSNGKGVNDGNNEGEGNGEGDGMSSSAASWRNTNPISFGDKDGVACRGHDGSALRQ